MVGLQYIGLREMRVASPRTHLFTASLRDGMVISQLALSVRRCLQAVLLVDHERCLVLKLLRRRLW